MKLKKNSKTIIIITLGIFIVISTILSSNINLIPGNNYPCLDLNQESNFYGRNIQTSKISGKIHIDDNDPSSNWSVSKSLGICTGYGTYSEPYVIEDLVIDGKTSGNCIVIENTDAYFKIENCTVYNSSNVGIKLSNVTNGTLFNNNCSNNDMGIYVANSNSNNITGCISNYNSNSGISLYNSHYNEIKRNIAIDNELYGIKLFYSDYNTFLGNILIHDIVGINLLYSNNNDIFGNIANCCSRGISLSNSYPTNISGNKMNECGLALSIGRYEADSLTIDTTNLVNGKPIYYYVNELNLGPLNFTNAGQVILFNCHNSLISNLTTSNCSEGISLYYCNNNTISGNTASNNDSGIFLAYCHHSNISGNTANNNYYGIHSPGSKYNIFSENSVNNNHWGIWLYGSKYTAILSNTANNNYYAGICLEWYSENTFVIGNTANYNAYGISLSGANNNTIFDNTANNNTLGVYLFSSDYNTVSGNSLLGNNQCIHEIRCEGNQFCDNGSCTYGDCDETNGTIPGYNLIFLLGVISLILLIGKKNLTGSEKCSNTTVN